MKKKFEQIVDVRFRHCDPAGIVFYPRYFEMVNDLVEDWFAKELHYPFKEIHKGEGIPTVTISVNFLKASRLGDVLRNRLWIIKLGKSSLTYGFEFTCADTIILQGEGTIVFVDISGNTITPKGWTNHLKKYFSSFEIEK